jgi:hypothetical protein
MAVLQIQTFCGILLDEIAYRLVVSDIQHVGNRLIAGAPSA